MTVRVFGIRHHGPGSARSLLSALDKLSPDAVLVEGPPEAQAVLPLMARPEMQPPVALLVYPPDAPQDAAYYPFARFSPEWNALRYALGSGVTARFVDLPRALDLEDEDDADPEVREDPIGLLAEAAGYEDRELWWERQVEQRRDATDLFAVIIEAMAALREDYEPPPREARREAYMRREIRKTLQEGHANIAVVCGAWHAPALHLEGHDVKSDDALLKGLKKRKTSATWIPWTAGRLSYRSGYGAGIASPGYYEHLWNSPDGSVASRWLSHVARLLRSEDLDASPANVWGNTVGAASASRVRELAETADLPRLTALLDAVILARLPESAVWHLLGRVRHNAASAEVRRLMDALPPLARVARYGDVRGTGAASVLPVIDILFERALVSLPGACTSLDDDAAREMAGSIAAGEECVNLLDRSGMHEKWHAVLGPLAQNESVNALLRGWCCRLLLEAGSLDEEELQRLAGLSLSPAVPAPKAAAWVEGVLRGSGLVLLNQTGLWMALDGRLAGLDPETFTSLLPLVRRAFSDFEPAEKRAMGERVRKLGSGGKPARRTETMGPGTWTTGGRPARCPSSLRYLGWSTMDEKERLRRWRLVLGSDSEATIGAGLGGEDRGMDGVLAALYDGEKDSKNVGHGGSLPNVTRWLGDIRTYFPSSVVRVMQKDALDRLGLQRMLLEPEMLEAVEPDVHLVATLISLGRVIPEKTKDSARRLVRKVVEALERRLARETEQAVRGALNRAARTSRPRPADIDWERTIRANLKNYLPEHGTVIPERLVGHSRRKSTATLRDIVLCVDQSGSMATSVVYSGIFGAVLASIRAVNTRMVVYDTSVADLTEDLQDPVDLLFGTQLGGGNDTPRALAYCQSIITRPAETVMVLLTDCYEGGLSEAMLERTARIVDSGVTMVCLLALGDDGAPTYDRQQAAAMASLGVPTFACTPDLFPGMMAAAIQKQDLDLWAARNEIVTARSS